MLLQDEICRLLKRDNPDLVEQQIALGEVEQPDLTNLLVGAVFRNRPRIVEFLLSVGADINGRDISQTSSLEAAIEGSNPGMIRYLVEKGAHINSRNHHGMTPLLWAIDLEVECARTEGEEKAQTVAPSAVLTALLLQLGADPNQTSDKGESAEAFASRRGHRVAAEIISNMLKGE